MAKVSLYLDTRYSSKTKVYPLKIRISHKGANRYLQTEYTSTKENWDNKLAQFKKKTPEIPNLKATNLKLQKLIIELKETLYEIKHINLLSVDDVKERIEAVQNGDHYNPSSFTQYYKKQIELMKARPGRTWGIYKETLKRINNFTNNENINFNSINKHWLETYENWMASNGYSQTTRSLDFRNIRAIINKALDEPTPLIPFELYPFGRRGFKIPKPKTKHRNLSLDHFRAIAQFHAPDLQSTEIGRDAFLLSFLLQGINPVDLFHLKKGCIQGERLVYERRKTKRDYSIKIHPMAMDIIKKHQGSGERLLFYSERYANKNSMANGFNKSLERITKKIDIPVCSMYHARHSWATYAAELEIPKETIAAALGHGQKTVTDIYINFDQEKVDKANKKVIEYAFNLKKKQKS
ncbi:phage integrase SAM-like domain-containing protein [Carboxylicivirga sediminis]|uniref:Phage integrase SAM-like domain-containing protein n=1 Tax=Carboxylicivirga sediminis TaxID=2006564 RepID=A0A941IXC5_9BACT|nr:phage integrase SAM-like domain-containing protein [Carboxylicivirga sediminis]MBR8535453.1 phage integrase SAM-like domain-containing protein [Carboxylicivirga sediminis]